MLANAFSRKHKTHVEHTNIAASSGIMAAFEEVTVTENDNTDNADSFQFGFSPAPVPAPVPSTVPTTVPTTVPAPIIAATVPSPVSEDEKYDDDDDDNNKEEGEATTVNKKTLKRRLRRKRTKDNKAKGKAEQSPTLLNGSMNIGSMNIGSMNIASMNCNSLTSFCPIPSQILHPLPLPPPPGLEHYITTARTNAPTSVNYSRRTTWDMESTAEKTVPVAVVNKKSLALHKSKADTKDIGGDVIGSGWGSNNAFSFGF